MVFIIAGMGGGTGTGAAPVIARIASERGILTIGVVTKPFHFEGAHRMRTAESGINELQQFVDTLIVLSNQNLFRVATEHTTFADAFNMADQTVYWGVRTVTDLLFMPGLINLDFEDIRCIISEMGLAMMGFGEAEGDNRATKAAEAAISSPLMDAASINGAKGLLINITGGLDMTLFEIDEAANRVRDEVDDEANIIFGSTFDEKLNGKIRVSVIATGIPLDEGKLPKSGLISLLEAQRIPLKRGRSAADVSTSIERDDWRDKAIHLPGSLSTAVRDLTEPFKSPRRSGSLLDRVVNPQKAPELAAVASQPALAEAGAVEKISPEQCRTARAMLNWSQDDLAARADVSKKTIADFERGSRLPYRLTLDDICSAFAAEGVCFAKNGVGIRANRTFEVDDSGHRSGEAQPVPFSPEQCRAARAILGLSQEELASRSGVGKKTIADYENTSRSPHGRTLMAIRVALIDSGANFSCEGDVVIVSRGDEGGGARDAQRQH